MKNMVPITVLLANDQPVLSEGMRVLLAGQPDIRIAGEAASGSDVV